jgi:hypothetical protein
MNINKFRLLERINKLQTKLEWQLPKLVTQDLRTMNGRYKKEDVLTHHVKALPHSFYEFLFQNMKYIPNSELKKFEKQLKQEIGINHIHLSEETKRWLR